MSDLRLYVFLRSDMESMTPGKAAAQVAHAASQAAYKAYKPTGIHNEYNDWQNESSKEHGYHSCYTGFGTTIVLDGGSFVDTFDKTTNVSLETLLPNYNLKGIVKDPTYPLKDGKKTHYIDIVTCWWALIDLEDITEYNLSRLREHKLYEGNHD